MGPAEVAFGADERVRTDAGRQVLARIAASSEDVDALPPAATAVHGGAEDVVADLALLDPPVMVLLPRADVAGQSAVGSLSRRADAAKAPARG